MRSILFLIVLFFLCGCDTSTVDNQSFLKSLPADELKLANAFAKADDNDTMAENEIKKKENLDSTIVAVDDYVRNTLNAKILNWKALVEGINVKEDPLEGKTINLTLFIPNKDSYDRERLYAGIQLRSSIKYNNDSLKRVIETLKRFDTVSITGKFELPSSGKIDLLDETNLGGTELYNPSFKVEISEIKKIK